MVVLAGGSMKTLNGQSGDMTEQSSNVETYWVVDVFGQNDQVKVHSFSPSLNSWLLAQQ